MHLVYVDESGDDGFSHNNIYSPATMPKRFFIRVALIVHDWKWQSINHKITQFRSKWKIPPQVELHATEILNGYFKKHDPKTKKRLQLPNWFGSNYPNRNDRHMLLTAACNLIASLDLLLVCIAIDKSKIDIRNPQYRELPKNNSWEFLIERINLFLEYATDKCGMIISDAVAHEIDLENREFAKALYAQSSHIKQFHFIESILFEPSESSQLLQLVDIAAFAFHRKLNMDDSSYYDIIASGLFEHNGRTDGVGLKIWPQ